MHSLLSAIAQLPTPREAQRLFHGRGRLHADSHVWTLDAYPPAWVVTSYEPADEAQLQRIDDALCARWAELGQPQPPIWVYQFRPQGRQKAPAQTRLMRGTLPRPHVVEEAGLRFHVDLLRGQNHGLFLDMAQGRAWVRAQIAAWRAAGQPTRVLNLFAYTCAFSVAACAGGAERVVNVDLSQSALATGARNHQLNGLLPQGERGRVQFLPHDVFKTWGRIGRAGPYELVIVDPPSYQRGSFVARDDYPRLLRRLPGLLAPGGVALLCLNAPEIPTATLLAQIQACAPALRVRERLPNPRAFADHNEDRSLRVLVAECDAGATPDSVTD